MVLKETPANHSWRSGEGASAREVGCVAFASGLDTTVPVVEGELTRRGGGLDW